MEGIFLLLALAAVKAEVHDVLILGAGASGLSAAKTLHDAGITDFVILEADDRIGGRVRSAQFAGETVELCARWIQGIGTPQNPNPIWTLAQTYNLKTAPFDYDDWVVYDSDGNDVTTEAYDFYDILDEAVAKSDEKAAEKLRKHEPDVSYRSALLSGGWAPKTAVEDLCDWWEIDSEYAAAAELISLKHGRNVDSNAEAYPGDDHIVYDSRGFVYLFQKYSEEFLTDNDARLKLNHKVTKVEYTHHPQKESVKVTTEDGQIFEARFAIVTFSLGVFQNALVEYSPPLPTWKTDVLNTMLMAKYLDIQIKFPDGTPNFWGENLNILHASERKGYYPFFVNIRVYNPDSKLLFANVVGEEAVMVSRQPKAKTIEQLNNVLKTIYGTMAVDIEDILFFDALTNPLFMGSYTTLMYGITDKTFNSVKAPVGPIHFAGEHTSLEFFGYLHGAYITGIREAENVVECIQNRYCLNTVYMPFQRPGFYYKKKK